MMKTFRMFGMALFAILVCVNFTSCDKEEEETATIYGEWRIVSEEYWDYEDGKLISHELDEDFDEYYIILRFNEDGTFCSIKGDSEESYESWGTYSYKDGMLTTEVGEDGPWKVTTLTSSTLVMKTTYGGDSYKSIIQVTYNRVK